MSDPEQVTYCGLYCGLCAQHTRIPELSEQLRGAMEKEDYMQWSQGIPNFKEFWTFLNMLCSSNKKSYCRKENCGPPLCSIRKCAGEKKLEVCVFCTEYPCGRILGLAKSYPTLLADGKRMKEIGIEKWIREQEERRKTGFAYVDIRCYPYKVPDK